MMNEYRAYAQEVAQRYGIPTELFLNLVTQESSWNPQAISPKGAIGLTQLMPGTAGDLGVDPTDWRQNLEGGARYLKQQVDRFQSWPRALAAYNAGPRRVAESGGIPNIKETRNYIDRIMAGYSGGSEIAKDAMAALGQGGASMTPQAMPGLLAQDAAATARPMPARQTTDYGNLLDALAIGFSGMTLRPNEGLAQLAQERIKGRREQAQRNATADWLESQGMTQYADAVRQGVLGGSEALKLARGGEARDPYSTIGKLQADLAEGLINQEQYDVALQGLAPQGMAIESTPDGGIRFVQGPGAASARPFTEGQSKDLVYATRAEGALAALEPVAGALTSMGQRAAGADPTGIIRGSVQTPEFQKAKQAGDEFLQAILRKDTGAAITPDEQRLYGTTYLPQPGDGDAVLEQKRLARARAVDAIRRGMGPEQLLRLEGIGAAAPTGDQPPPATRMRFDAEGNLIND